MSYVFLRLSTDTSTPTATPTPVPPYNVTINYFYDPLYRLTEANYSAGRYFHYTYDAVGNRLSEVKCVATVFGVPCPTPITNTYTYVSANRLTSVNPSTGLGQAAYTWDNNPTPPLRGFGDFAATCSTMARTRIPTIPPIA
jgi:hypothetical protein